MHKGIFIDDRKTDKTYVDLLSDENVQFHFIRPEMPIADLAEEVIGQNPDIVALDYRLDEEPCGPSDSDRDKPNRYKASPLAQQLRDLALQNPLKDFPIILVSNEDNIQSLYDQDKTAHDLFDHVLPKGKIADDSSMAIRKALGLISGYKKIINVWDDEDRISSALCLESLPISQQELSSLNDCNAPHQLARNILQYIIKRNGLLIDEYGLEATLGLDRKNSDMYSLLNLLIQEDIVYKGAFSDGWLRFVKDKLVDWANEKCGASGIAKKLGDATEIKLVPAKSRWETSETNPMFSLPCASCNLPTELDYSVPAYDPVLFDFIQRKVICWDCVARGRYKNEGLEVDETGLFFSQKIEAGEITPRSDT